MHNTSITPVKYQTPFKRTKQEAVYRFMDMLGKPGAAVTNDVADFSIINRAKAYLNKYLLDKIFNLYTIQAFGGKCRDLYKQLGLSVKNFKDIKPIKSKEPKCHWIYSIIDKTGRYVNVCRCFDVWNSNGYDKQVIFDNKTGDYLRTIREYPNKKFILSNSRGDFIIGNENNDIKLMHYNSFKSMLRSFRKIIPEFSQN